MRTMKVYRDWIIVLAACVACGGPLRYQTASTGKAPGADAEIEADVSEKQGQTRLTVSIKNLPPPDRIAPDSQHYVAWYRQGPKGVWQRVAAVRPVFYQEQVLPLLPPLPPEILIDDEVSKR